MKNILVAVSGLSPQVVTETLYCLEVKKKIRIDEIYVITTTRGKDVITGKDEEYNIKRKYPTLISQIEKVCKKYDINLPKFENTSKYIITADEQTIEMYDIRNDIHNKLFPNKVCEVLKNLSSSNENILHCSLSGGRKTMCVDMALAISIFGGNNDKLYHVLTDDKLENSKFYPENAQESKMLEIAEIPFIRLRSLLAKSTNNKLFNNMSYLDIVKHLQNELKILSTDKLTLNIKRGEIVYGENEIVKIAPIQSNLYTYIINNSDSDSGICISKLEEYLYGKFEKDNKIRTVISKTNNALLKAVSDENYALFEIDNLGKDEISGLGIYGVKAPRNKIQIIKD